MEEDEEENLDNGKILSEDEDVERIKEESRRRRQAILEKYKNQNELKNQLKEPEGIILKMLGFFVVFIVCCNLTSEILQETI
jgi:hypothetical protein